jgi:hypothetical protein
LVRTARPGFPRRKIGNATLGCRRLGFPVVGSAVGRWQSKSHRWCATLTTPIPNCGSLMPSPISKVLRRLSTPLCCLRFISNQDLPHSNFLDYAILEPEVCPAVIDSVDVTSFKAAPCSVMHTRRRVEHEASRGSSGSAAASRGDASGVEGRRKPWHNGK